MALNSLKRGVPEVWGSMYDVRALLNAAAVMRDGEKLKPPAMIMEHLEGTDIEDLMCHYGLIDGHDEEYTNTASPPRKFSCTVMTTVDCEIK